jgi:hypothetical protein
MRVYFVSMPVPFVILSTSREPANQPKSAIIRIIAITIDLLVPHIAQNTSSLRDRLLLPTGSAGSGVVVGWPALHFGDLAELGSVGLGSYNVRKRSGM